MISRVANLLLSLIIMAFATACERPPTSYTSPAELIGKAAPETNGAYLGEARENQHPCTLRIIWATWCEPCKEELPQLDDWMESAETPADVELVLGDPDTTRDAAERFLETYGVVYGTTLGEDGLLRAHGLRGLPTAFLIGPTGEVVAYKEGPFDEGSLHEFLDRDACR
jgi:thiol-disulfide isomerase/thioredoxin